MHLFFSNKSFEVTEKVEISKFFLFFTGSINEYAVLALLPLSIFCETGPTPS